MKDEVIENDDCVVISSKEKTWNGVGLYALVAPKVKGHFIT